MWTPLGQKTERVQVMTAVEDHIALRSQATQPEDNTCHHTQGRLVHLKLALPHSKPLTISAVYAPVGSQGSDDQELRETIHRELEQHMRTTHIIMGTRMPACSQATGSTTDVSRKTRTKNPLLSATALSPWTHT